MTKHYLLLLINDDVITFCVFVLTVVYMPMFCVTG